MISQDLLFIRREYRAMGLYCHHMLPKSRCPSRIYDPTNWKWITYEQHEAYHWLFGDLLPQEIERGLLSGRIEVVSARDYTAWGMVFGEHVSVEQAAQKIKTEWTPPPAPLVRPSVVISRHVALVERHGQSTEALDVMTPHGSCVCGGGREYLTIGFIGCVQCGAVQRISSSVSGVRRRRRAASQWYRVANQGV